MQFNLILVVIFINVRKLNGFAEKLDDIIYLLLWPANGDNDGMVDKPFNVMQYGRASFIKRNCAYNNCYFTNDINFFDDLLKFDVILFNVFYTKSYMDIPERRSENQTYVLVGLEPAGFHKVTNKMNKFFNFTWTYKLDSDVVFPYIVVKNDRDEIIGPRRDMHWIDLKGMNETSVYVKNKLRKKRIAAAWFVSNCYALNERLEYARALNADLEKFSQRVDIYGSCGTKWCAEDESYALIESTYYFYLAFENSFGEDYVSEKILTALEHFAVPIVLGGANYTRFMLNGIFLDARAFTPAKLAREMIDIMYNKSRYYDFFRWHGYYSFHHTGENDFRNEICGLCNTLNNKIRMSRKNVVRTNLWWNEWYDGIPKPTPGVMRLLIDEENPKPAGVDGLVSNFYNHVFD